MAEFAHIGIVGHTGSGKTTISVHLVRATIKKEKQKAKRIRGYKPRPVIIHTPKGASRFPKEAIKVRDIDNLELVLKVVDEEETGAYVFLDEVIDLVEDANPKKHINFLRLHRKGRHAGITAIYICQDYFEIPPRVRRNLADLYILQSEIIVAQRIARDNRAVKMNLEKEIMKLKKYTAIHIEQKQKARILKIPKD